MHLWEDTPEHILKQGLKLDIEAWIQERIAEDPEFYAVDDTVRGEVVWIDALSPALDTLARKPKKAVFVGILPVRSSWEVPAYLKPGGWNECPEPAVHVAMFHRWFERYRAQVTTITHDIIEFSVARPPQTKAEARALALEQFVYCGDIVQQGVGTLGNLTVGLVKARNWYFWWD